MHIRCASEACHRICEQAKTESTLSTQRRGKAQEMTNELQAECAAFSDVIMPIRIIRTPCSYTMRVVLTTIYTKYYACNRNSVQPKPKPKPNRD